MIIMQGEVPQLCMNIVPLDERHDICLLNHALKDIEKYTRQFGAAVHLFDYCGMQDSVLSSRRRTRLGVWVLEIAGLPRRRRVASEFSRPIGDREQYFGEFGLSRRRARSELVRKGAFKI